MTCEKCKKDFNPRQQEVLQGGYEDTLEIQIACPHCNASYSHWVNPERDWALND